MVLTLQRPLVATRDLELRNAVPADLPAADADEARLEQIFLYVGNGDGVLEYDGDSWRLIETTTRSGCMNSGSYQDRYMTVPRFFEALEL